MIPIPEKWLVSTWYATLENRVLADSLSRILQSDVVGLVISHSPEAIGLAGSGINVSI